MKLPLLAAAAFFLTGAAALATVATLTKGAAGTAPAVASEIPTDAPATPVVFSVPDMHCEFACAPTVRKTLAALPGVKRVETDVENHTATVYATAAFDPAKAVTALAAEGYTGEPAAN